MSGLSERWGIAAWGGARFGAWPVLSIVRADIKECSGLKRTELAILLASASGGTSFVLPLAVSSRTPVWMVSASVSCAAAV
jgi:hypothetical protein